jgi:hypothetical protein
MGFNPSVAQPARRYNYWLGGRDNFAADRVAGDRAAQAFPGVWTTAVQNRAFLGRAVEFAAAGLGIRQFLDIGCGIPASGSTHEVAQRVLPDARVVYVDNDPMVGVHTRALTTSTPQGTTGYIDADLRDPERILADKSLIGALDLSRPVALVLVAVLHFLPGEDAFTAVRALLDPLVAGSCLVLSHGCLDDIGADERGKLLASRSVDDFTNRTVEEIGRFFAGTDLVDPGLTLVSRWRPRPRERVPADDQIACYGGVAIKPGQR